jgi:hypothetical protein
MVKVHGKRNGEIFVSVIFFLFNGQNGEIYCILEDYKIFFADKIYFLDNQSNLMYNCGIEDSNYKRYYFTFYCLIKNILTRTLQQ